MIEVHLKDIEQVARGEAGRMLARYTVAFETQYLALIGGTFYTRKVKKSKKKLQKIILIEKQGHFGI